MAETMALRAGDGTTGPTTLLTYVPAGADAATRAAASIDVTLGHDPVVSYLGFLLNESGSSEAHAASAQRRARAVIRWPRRNPRCARRVGVAV